MKGRGGKSCKTRSGRAAFARTARSAGSIGPAAARTGFAPRGRSIPGCPKWNNIPARSTTRIHTMDHHFLGIDNGGSVTRAVLFGARAWQYPAQSRAMGQGRNDGARGILRGCRRPRASRRLCGAGSARRERSCEPCRMTRGSVLDDQKILVTSIPAKSFKTNRRAGLQIEMVLR